MLFQLIAGVSMTMLVSYHITSNSAKYGGHLENSRHFGFENLKFELPEHRKRNFNLLHEFL